MALTFRYRGFTGELIRYDGESVWQSAHPTLLIQVAGDSTLNGQRMTRLRPYFCRRNEGHILSAQGAQVLAVYLPLIQNVRFGDFEIG